MERIVKTYANAKTEAHVSLNQVDAFVNVVTQVRGVTVRVRKAFMGPIANRHVLHVPLVMALVTISRANANASQGTRGSSAWNLVPRAPSGDAVWGSAIARIMASVIMSTESADVQVDGWDLIAVSHVLWEHLVPIAPTHVTAITTPLATQLTAAASANPDTLEPVARNSVQRDIGARIAMRRVSVPMKTLSVIPLRDVCAVLDLLGAIARCPLPIQRPELEIWKAPVIREPFPKTIPIVEHWLA